MGTGVPEVVTVADALCIVLLGRQGSGKGTQAALLAEAYGWVHISTGDMLRSAVDAGSELGRQAEALLLSGQLVGDDIIVGVVAERLQSEDVLLGGVLLDGFPRNVEQAEALETILAEQGRSVDLAVHLDVGVDAATERMMLRGRPDDTSAAIARRLADYEEQTLPLRCWFADRGILAEVDGFGAVGEVFNRIVSAVEDAGCLPASAAADGRAPPMGASGRSIGLSRSK